MKYTNIATAFLIGLSTLFTGCTPSPETQLQQLTGYWEIESVEFPGGDTKEFDVNTTVDYIELTTDSTGFRKKMQPRLDGEYYTTNDSENFSIGLKDNRLILKYHTSLSQWEEEVIKLTENRLILRNADNLNYLYKRYEPLDLGDLQEK
ncbi:lipocalin-like domain-containing protein [Sinomicrobium sp.]